jgi:hypothetical protein
MPSLRGAQVGQTTPTDPRSQRIRASRRGGHVLTRARSPSNDHRPAQPAFAPGCPCPGRSHRTPQLAGHHQQPIRGAGGIHGLSYQLRIPSSRPLAGAGQNQHSQGPWRQGRWAPDGVQAAGGGRAAVAGGQRPTPCGPGAGRGQIRAGQAGRANQGGARGGHQRGRRVIMRDQRSTEFDDSSRRTYGQGPRTNVSPTVRCRSLKLADRG